MFHKTFHIEYNDLDLDLKRIENVLGYGKGDDSTIVNALTAEILNEPDLFRNIRAEYKIYSAIEFDDRDKSLTVNNVNFAINKIVFGQLKKADSLAVFLSTAGGELGARSRYAMSEGDPLKGYIYDMIGSLVADAAADRMEDELQKTVSESGKRITNRYCPGYCGWDVSEQHKLFRLIPDNFCGISLSGSALMNPIKSISGIIGIGRNVRYNKYTCRLCDMKNCTYREAGAGAV